MNRRKLSLSGPFPPADRVPLTLAASVVFALAVAGCEVRHRPAQACRRRRKSASPPVLSKQVRQWDDFTGRVAAVETVELRPRVSGERCAARGV